jgi:hypothetical protein
MHENKNDIQIKILVFISSIFITESVLFFLGIPYWTSVNVFRLFVFFK